MEKKKNLIVNKFYANNINIDNLYKTINMQYYNEEIGYGFVNTYKDNDEVSSTLIKRSNTQINHYNLEAKTFEKKAIFIYTEITFTIDLAKSILITYGTAPQQAIVKSVLKETLSNISVIEPYNLSPYIFFQKLNNNDYKYEITEITIQDFRYNKDIVGKYHAQIFNQRIANTLIEKYTTNLSRISVTLWSSNTDFNVTVLLNGSISITGEEEDFEQNTYFLTSILIE